jgi:hypothetical protein
MIQVDFEKMWREEKERADEAVRNGQEAHDLSVEIQARAEAAEAKVAAITARLEEAEKGWRCFHCGEAFTDEALARDHFAIEGIPPMCVDPLTKDENTRMVVVRKLEAELVKWRAENEQLDHEAGCYHAYQAELGRYFGTCAGFPVKTPQQAFLVYEAMIGAKEAAEREQAAVIERARQILDPALALLWEVQSDLSPQPSGYRAKGSAGRAFSRLMDNYDIVMKAGWEARERLASLPAPQEKHHD